MILGCDIIMLLENQTRRYDLLETFPSRLILSSIILIPFLFSGCQTSPSVAPSEHRSLPAVQGHFQPQMAGGSEDAHYKLFYLESISRLNDATKDTPYVELPLPELIKLTKGQPSEVDVFRSASDVWNHEFFWKSVKTGGGGQPSGRLLASIEKTFGDYENFEVEFLNAAEQLEGNGWLWLVLENETIKIITTSNYDTPLSDSVKPLLALDLWEHAYLSKYSSNRRQYAKDFLNNLANWEFAEANL